MMPGMSGPQLAERTHLDYRAVAVVFMSGYTSDECSARVSKRVRRIRSKPFSTTALAARLRHVLELADITHESCALHDDTHVADPPIVWASEEVCDSAT